MEQLLLHLWGDYITQTDKMAINKVKNIKYAIYHSFIYTIPFIILTQSIIALLLIFSSHVIIDRYRLAKYFIFYKNWLFDKTLKWEDCSMFGLHNTRPEYLAFWLMVIVDNTLHLTLNFISLTFF